MRAFFISTLEPTPGERRAAAIVALLSLLVFAVAAPHARVPLARQPAFLPAYQAALVVNEAITAVMLLGQYRMLGAPSLLVLACGYLFSVLMGVLHALSFPGLFAPGGLLGAGPQTTAWLYFLWHGGFPLFVIGYALLGDEGGLASPEDRRPLRRIAAGMAAVSVLVGALVLLTTAGHWMLPPLMAGDADAPAKMEVAAVTWAIGLVALVAVWRRQPRSVLGMWLMVVVLVWLLDTALAAVFNHSRYDAGWYVGRAFGLIASGCVLVVLLLESARLYAKLAVSVAGERQKAAELRSLSEQLQSANDRQAEQNQRLAEASRLKSEFLANMSHELRTPLNAVIGFSEVLKDGIVGDLSAEQQEYVTDIYVSGKHLLSLINDVLDLSKIEAGQASLDLDVVAADELFGNALTIVKEQAAKRGVELVLDLAAGLGSLAIDPRKIKQITYNLLSNAVKFSPRGGRVTLRVRRVARPEVEGWSPLAETVVRRPLPAGDTESFLEICVEDEGIGIAKEDAPRLFQVFTQIDSSLAKEAEGTGLGLVLVDRLAALHGGAVALASTPGRGSRVFAWVPWRVLPAASTAWPQDRPPAGLGGPRPLALVVEDNGHAAELMRLHLESEGYRVLRAADGRQALDLLEEHLPAVIVLDLLLPDMDGWDLLALLRQADSRVSRVPVVIVSIVADARKGFSLGASAVLQKPIGREELLQALKDTGVAAAVPPVKILLVDDDPREVDRLARYLADPRYEVTRAVGGRQGIDLARRECPDLIVLDLLMPEVSGLDVVAALQESAETSAIPIMVVTAQSLTAQERDALHRLVAIVLEKTAFDQREFVREVSRAVASREGAQA
jgi:signal transduction histidine kinase/DNA-binding response OmpR family regulator